LSNDVARIAPFSDTLEIETVGEGKGALGWLGGVSEREAPEMFPWFNRLRLGGWES